MTKAFVLGNLVKDPDFRTTTSGVSVCDLCVAVNGRREDDVSFFNVTVFGKQADQCRQYLEKGARVLVEGHLKQERFEGRDGKKHSKVVIIGESVSFLSGPPPQRERPEYDQPPVNWN